MKKIKINFERCIQNEQKLSKETGYMISQVFLTLEYPDKTTKGLTINIKQTNGSDYETDPIEVYIPENLQKDYNYIQFRDEVEKYYRKLVGSSASGIRIVGAAVNTEMYNNLFSISAIAEIDYIDKQD